MSLTIADEDLGGARVRRRFQMGVKWILPGDNLTGDELRAMPVANRRALVDSNYIEPYPNSPRQTVAGDRHIVHRGGGQFDVIEGVRLNDRPLSKDEAEELATRPE